MQQKEKLGFFTKGFLSALFLTLGSLPVMAEYAPVHPQPNCTADIPLHEPGITTEAIKLPFNQLLSESYKNADLLFIGDVSHEDLRVANYLATQGTMTELQRNGVKHIFVEMPANTQRWANLLAAGKDTKKSFISNMLLSNYHAGDQRQTVGILSMIADTIASASRSGIKVHFIDADRGFEEQAAAEKAERKASMIINSGMYTPAQVEAAVAAAREADRKYNLVRLDDRSTADYINKAMAPGEKGLLYYGAMHGSRFNDFEEFFKMPSLRLDLHADNASYHILMGTFQQDAQTIPLRKGEDKPDMVYVLDEQELYLTCATPKALSDRFPQVPADIPKPQM